MAAGRVCFFGESDFPQQKAISWEDRELRSIIQHPGEKSFNLEGSSGWQYTASTSPSGQYCFLGHLKSTSLMLINTFIETPLFVNPYHKLCIIFIYCHIFFTLKTTKKFLPCFSHPMNPCITWEKTTLVEAYELRTDGILGAWSSLSVTQFSLWNGWTCFGCLGLDSIRIERVFCHPHLTGRNLESDFLLFAFLLCPSILGHVI